MSRTDSRRPCWVVFDAERLRALGRLLRHSSTEIQTEVRGYSMESALPEGTRIRIRFAAVDRLAVGQIVTYIAKDRIVAHRLVRIATSGDDPYVITRGDATICCDPPVPASSVIGIVTDCCKGGSWQPVGLPPKRTRAFHLMASATSATVTTLLRLNPRISCWAAATLVEMRRFIRTFEGWAKRLRCADGWDAITSEPRK